jgi:hypothetical protein
MLDSMIRLNPLFRIKPVDELTEAQRIGFRRVLSGKNVHSLLHAPREAKLSVKALNRELAELLTCLREPARVADLPARFVERSGPELQRIIVRLILDGVLEVDSDGTFISGLEALNRVMSPPKPDAADVTGETNFTRVVSGTALDFALASVYTHPRDLSWILYNFNRLPMHRIRRRLLHDESSVARFFDLDAEGRWPGMPDSVRPIPPDRNEDGEYLPFFQIWRSWRIGRRRRGKEELGYKVYFSPLPGDAPAVFKIVRDRAAEAGAHAMKTARVVSALLRPDKLIVYFTRISTALRFADSMLDATHPYRGQGVPFTYQTDPRSPLISVGVDPPGAFGIENSWRRYVTDRLALAIQGAHRSDAEDVRGYIRSYMNMFGVDVDEWRPVKRDWSMEFDLDAE